MSSYKEALETAAQNTVPIPVSISGLSFLGVTFKDWVFVGTAVLVIFQLIVMTPKVIKIVESFINRFRSKEESP